MNYTHINPKKAARQERDREFMQMYRLALERFIESQVSNAKLAAIEWTIHNSSPRYYVSYERAYRVICQIIRQGKTPIKPSLQAQMWEEIAERVRQLMRGRKASVAQALEFVLEHCRASRFFITPHYAYTTLVDRARHEHAARRRGA